MEVAGDRRVAGEAGEANVYADNQGFSGVQVRDLDDTDEVTGTVGRDWVAKRGTSGLEELLDECSRLGAVEADVTAFTALLGVEGRCNATDANVQDVGVADTYLAVVLCIEVVLNEYGLVILAGWRVIDRDLGEEDDAVAACEVLGLKLFDHVGVDGPVIEGEVLALSSTDLAAFAWAVFVVGGVFGGDEVEGEVARIGVRGEAERHQSACEHEDGREDYPTASRQMDGVSAAIGPPV